MAGQPNPAGMPTGTTTPVPTPTSYTKSVCRGTMCKRTLSTIVWPSGNTSIFAIGINNGVYYKTGQGTSFDNNWSELGGYFIFPPAAVSWGEGRIDILGVGSDGAMWERHLNN